VIIVGSTFATGADFALRRIPGSQRSASSGYAWAVLSWKITKRKGALGPLRFIEPTWHSVHAEAHMAKAKFGVWFFVGGGRERIARCATYILARPKLSCERVFPRAPTRHAVIQCPSPSLPVTQNRITTFMDTTAWLRVGYFWMIWFGTSGDKIGLLFARCCWLLAIKSLATMLRLSPVTRIIYQSAGADDLEWHGVQASGCTLRPPKIQRL